MNKYILLSSAAVLALVSFNAKAADSATGTAQVEVVQPMSIDHASSDKLNFGSVYAKDGNTVTISQAGTKTAGSGFGTTSADKFTITGPASGSATLTMPTSATMTKSGGTDTITATLDPSKANGATVQPGDVINVGGTIAVSSTTPTGSYTGNYTVSISY